MKRFLTVFLVLLMLVPVFAGGSKEAEADDGTITLQIYWWGNQTRNNLTQEAIDLYMAQNPGIKIKAEFSDWTGYWDKLAATAAGGNMPDIVQMDYAYLNQYQENNLLADLTPFIESGVIDTTNIPESIIASGSVDGRCYAISLGSNAPSMIYDKGVVEKAGVTIPDQMTYSEYLALANEIYEKTGVKTVFDASITSNQMHARSYGADIFEELKAGDDTHVESFFEVVKEFNDAPSGILPEVLSEKDIYVVETKPIVTLATWNDYSFANMFIAVTNACGRELGLTAYAVPDDATNQPMYLKPSMFFSVAQNSKHQEEAAKFIDWFTNSLEANAILKAERGIPISTVVAEEVKKGVDETTALFFDYVTKVSEYATPIDPPDPAGKGEIEAIGNNLVEELRYGDQTVQSATKDFVTRAKNILNN